MADLVYIASMGINDLVKSLLKGKDETDFKDINASYFGKLIHNYFSFEGFYRVKKFGEESILLDKLKNPKNPESYNIVNLVFPSSTLALQKFSNEEESMVKGKIWERDIEGIISKVSWKKYEISINNKSN